MRTHHWSNNYSVFISKCTVCPNHFVKTLLLYTATVEKSTGCKPDASSQALHCWREQKALSHDFVLSKLYFLAGIRWAYDRLLFLHFRERLLWLPFSKECDIHCISAGWPSLLGSKWLQTVQRLTDLVRVVSGALIGKLKSHVCPLQSALLCHILTHWCLPCVPSGPLQCPGKKREERKKSLLSVGKKKQKKNILATSSPLFSTWAGWMQS